MTKQLSEADVEHIALLIDGLDNPSWNNILSAVSFHLRRTYTRQALSKYERIKTARDIRQRALSDPMKKRASPNTLAVLSSQIESLTSENMRFKEENRQLLEQLVRWSEIAYSKGIPLDVLEDIPSKQDRK